MNRLFPVALACGALLLSACEREPTPAPDAMQPQPPADQPQLPADAADPTAPIMVPPEAVHSTTGNVIAADPDAGWVTINHDPVDTLDWPAMRMNFEVEDRRQLLPLSTGERVRFTFYRAGDNRYVIRDITPA